ncbi:MAG: hypothetical protein Q9220_002853 [cf. Caloplaca sp. 1 TL-2023]
MASPNHPALDILRKSHPPENASAIFTEKILHKPLFLRPTSPDPNSQDARAHRRLQRLRKKEKSRRRQRPKPLSAKEKRMTGIYAIPKESQKYDIYVPLNRMWIEYMWDILGIVKGKPSRVMTAKGAGPMLASADYHGAKLEVVRSKCVSTVGLEGIVVRDTKFTFQIITKKNELKTIPKRYTTFRFSIPQPDAIAQHGKPVDGKDISEDEIGKPALIFEIHGSSFEHRATDRATKKFKQRNMTDL